MSPISRRTGKRYAAGSQAVFDGFPRVCSNEACELGGKIVMTPAKGKPHPALWFETREDGVARSWHFPCHPLIRGAER